MPRSPLHHWHVTHGAHMVAVDGWDLPTSYPAEDKSRSQFTLCDLSAHAKLSLRGPGVAHWVQLVIADGSASKLLGVSRAENGTLLCRLTEFHVLVLAS